MTPNNIHNRRGNSGWYLQHLKGFALCRGGETGPKDIHCCGGQVKPSCWTYSGFADHSGSQIWLTGGTLSGGDRICFSNSCKENVCKKWSSVCFGQCQEEGNCCLLLRDQLSQQDTEQGWCLGGEGYKNV